MSDMSFTQPDLFAIAGIPSPGYHSRPPRQRTFLAGMLVFGDGAFAPEDAFTLTCAIRDISEGGAKIILSRREPMPKDVFLIVVRHRIAYRAKIAWLNFPARGLKFLERYPLDASLPKELAVLRHLRSDLDMRSGIEALS